MIRQPTISTASDQETHVHTHRDRADTNMSSVSISVKSVPLGGKGEQSLSITDFEVLSKIGEGGFGTVLLVRKRSTGKLYALKVLVKKNMRRTGDARRAISESAAMQEIKHPFVVTLHFAFQDVNHIYFVLEFVGGGDLYSHLERQTFPEEWCAARRAPLVPRLPAPPRARSDARLRPPHARTRRRATIYIAEIALAIEYVHSHDFVYRDLKPENILVAHDGHLKLADFGLAKKLTALAPGDSKEDEETGAEGGMARGRLNTMIGTMVRVAVADGDQRASGPAAARLFRAVWPQGGGCRAIWPARARARLWPGATARAPRARATPVACA
jgi:serine/threonine protein kinase